MTKHGRIPRNWAFLGLTLLSFLSAWSLSWTGLLQVLELKTLDYRFRLLGVQQTASPDIVIAEIDDNSIEHLEPVFGRWPWPRNVHSIFLRFMRQAGARVVSYDVLFLDRDVANPEADESLASETAKMDAIVHSVFLGNQNNEAVSGLPDSELLSRFSVAEVGPFLHFVQIDWPIPGIASVTPMIGHVANALDSDGPFRRYLLMANHSGRSFPSLALATALASEEQTLSDVKVAERHLEAGLLRVPLDEDWRLPIWFNGGPGTYTSYGYSHIVYSQLQIEEGLEPGIDPEKFRDKIVLVGVTATGLHDSFTTPYSGTASDTARTFRGVRLGKMQGVEVHANVVDNLIHGRYLTSVEGGWQWLFVLSISSLCLALIFATRLRVAALGSVLLLALYGALAYICFTARIQIPVAQVILGWGFAITAGLGYQYWFEGAEKKVVKQIFSRYVSRDVYDQLMEDPSAADLGGQRMVVTVLFSDLRGFTSMSEQREPEEILEQLNEYFSAMVEVIFDHQGTVDKFVGDMIMALFNAPLDDELHADHAVQCAIAMQQRLAQLNEDWKERGMPELASGVGINTGEVIAGNVGSESIQSYTVIGDNVNLGARLESLCKEFKANIIISGYTRSLLTGTYTVIELDEVIVKGKSHAVKIFGVES